MDRALPAAAEPSLPQSGESSTLRRLCYATLILMLAAGAWVRFSDRIAEIAPGLAAPAAAVPQPDRLRGLIELDLTPAAAETAAVQAMNLPAGDGAALQQAVARHRVRLVRLPLFERDGGTGGVVQVNAGGLTSVVHLSAEPVTLTIPMTHAATVTFRLLGAVPQGSLGIGAITLNGPVFLPALATGDVLQIGVVAQ